MGTTLSKVWVVFHCEVWNTDPYFCDEMLFHVATSLEKAEAYMKDVHIEPIAWWQVLEVTTDNADFHKDADEVYFYGNKGRRVKYPPRKRATRAFLKDHPTGRRDD